ncbi:hypothetical protein LINPERPRIM_LOCUS14169, partial [Linum perenne]
LRRLLHLLQLVTEHLQVNLPAGLTLPRFLCRRRRLHAQLPPSCTPDSRGVWIRWCRVWRLAKKFSRKKFTHCRTIQ